MEEAPLLAVRDLRLEVGDGARRQLLVDGVSFAVAPGEAVGLVGSSGSGKSLTALALLALQPPAVRRTGGSVRFAGTELGALSERELRLFRGGRVAYVFQDPATALNPVLRIGKQVEEVLAVHRPELARRRRATVAAELFAAVELPDPDTIGRRYPHELSGGQRQRALIAIALAGEPELLVADEPTTALDVTVQEQILALLRRLRAERELAMLWISHDLQLVRGLCDRVVVLDAGQVVEEGAPEELFAAPQHAATQALVAAALRDAEPPRGVDAAPEPLLRVAGLSVDYPGNGGRGAARRAVHGVSLELAAGETLALVGESGSGKTSVGRAVLRLLEGAAGEVRLRLPGQAAAVDWLALPEREARPLRRHLAMVFQDPAGALDPRMRVWESVAEPLRIHRLASGAALRASAEELLAAVELEAGFADRLPHQLSGGQAQRVGIARAMALDPALVVCDEAVSALDAEIQERILELFRRLQQERGPAYLFITHDLARCVRWPIGSR